MCFFIFWQLLNYMQRCDCYMHCGCTHAQWKFFAGSSSGLAYQLRGKDCSISLDSASCSFRKNVVCSFFFFGLSLVHVLKNCFMNISVRKSSNQQSFFFFFPFLRNIVVRIDQLPQSWHLLFPFFDNTSDIQLLVRKTAGWIVCETFWLIQV